MNMTSTLFNANQLAKQLLPNGSEFDLAHVSAALENIVEWKVEREASATIDLDEIVHEVKEHNMALGSKDAIIRALRTVRNAQFTCEWVLPEFRFNKSGFRYSEPKNPACNESLVNQVVAKTPPIVTSQPYHPFRMSGEAFGQPERPSDPDVPVST